MEFDRKKLRNKIRKIIIDTLEKEGVKTKPKRFPWEGECCELQREGESFFGVGNFWFLGLGLLCWSECLFGFFFLGISVIIKLVVLPVHIQRSYCRP